MPRTIRIADEVWVATALLTIDHPELPALPATDIIDRVFDENLAGRYRTSVPSYVYQHAVANLRPAPDAFRYLYRVRMGVRRLARPNDDHHPLRQDGPHRPDPSGLPPSHRWLIDWYDDRFATGAGPDPDGVYSSSSQSWPSS